MATARPRPVRPLKRLFLTDYADGCPGHYCISRMQDATTVEHWSREGWCFASFGTLYRSKADAKAAMAELRAFLKLSPKQQRLRQFDGGRSTTVKKVGEVGKGCAYCASIELRTVTLEAHADSPEIAMMLLGIKTGQWLLDGSVT